eukprot:Sspe_Gene.76827::Locus_47988_Transcript_1_1_Confidence_1.000_Length_514::g.76827::m.76827
MAVGTFAVLLIGITVSWALGLTSSLTAVAAAGASLYITILYMRAKVTPDSSGLPTVPPHVLLPIWKLAALPFTDGPLRKALRHQTHHVISQWADQLGGIYRVYIGSYPLVVVSDPSIAGQMLDAAHRDSFRDRLAEPNGLSFIVPEGLLALPT